MRMQNKTVHPVALMSAGYTCTTIISEAISRSLCRVCAAFALEASCALFSGLRRAAFIIAPYFPP